MARWKTKFLNIARRVILLKSTLHRIQTYIMKILQLPNFIIENINKIKKKFLWGTIDTKEKNTFNKLGYSHS